MDLHRNHRNSKKYVSGVRKLSSRETYFVALSLLCCCVYSKGSYRFIDGCWCGKDARTGDEEDSSEILSELHSCGCWVEILSRNIE